MVAFSYTEKEKYKCTHMVISMISRCVEKDTGFTEGIKQTKQNKVIFELLLEVKSELIKAKNDFRPWVSLLTTSVREW